MLRFGMGDPAPPYAKTFYTECSENTENTEKKIQHGSEDPPLQKPEKDLAGEAVFFRVEKFGEARIFLEEGKIFVVAGVVAILGVQLDGDFQIGERGIGFAGEAIERRQGVVDVVGLGGRFAGFVETFARVVPAADVHHGHPALIVLFGGARILFLRRLHALLGDLYVHARAVSEFFAGAFENFFELLLGSCEFLLMEEREGLVIDLELRLDARIDQFDTTTLGGRSRW
jgi:hypothetical protein